MTSLIAKRYDRLGGRLTSLSFALYISRAFGFPVRLSWPYGRIHPMHIDPEDVFSPEFLDGRMIDPKDVRQILARQGDGPADHRVIDALSEDEIPSDLNPGPVGPFVNVLPPKCFAPAIRAAMETLQGQDYSGIHIRHGDLVHGQWRHFGYMERFIPYDASLHFIQSTCAPGEVRVHSDEPLAAQHLSQMAAEAGMSDHRFVSSRGFDGLDPDVFDIFHMAHAREIIAPVKSAYSGFAARYHAHPRRDQTPEALKPWVEQNIASPKDMISVLYSAKRHLFIIRMLRELGQTDAHLANIHRLLAHVEATGAENAELYLLKMAFLPTSAPMSGFDADLAAYVAMMEELRTFMPPRGGSVRLNELIEQLDPNDRRIAPIKEAIEVIHPL